MFTVAFDSTVGSTNWSFDPVFPPSIKAAPLESASSMWRRTLSTAARLISGPTVTPSRSPLPTTSFDAAPNRRSANLS
jgi:hypothetical protein